MKKFLLIGAVLLLIAGCVEKPQPEPTDAQKFKEAYEALNGQENDNGQAHKTLAISENNPMYYATQEEVETLLTNGTGIIFFGFPECPWCRNTLPVFLEACEQEIVTRVCYFNNKEERNTMELQEGKAVETKQGSEGYYRLLELLGTWASVYDGMEDESIRRIYFPTYVFVKDGVIVDVQVSSLDSVTDPRADLTDQQHQELFELFVEKIRSAKACDDKC